jgi:Divergent InlB B-repeat domain
MQDYAAKSTQINIGWLVSRMKRWVAISLVLISFASHPTTALGALDASASTATMKVYDEGGEKLTVYTDVPGSEASMINGYQSRAKSNIYEIWVRSAASNNQWVQCFANMTYNRGAEMPLMDSFQTPTATHAYQKHTAGWTHTYANIEMSENSPVEVEIRKIGNTPLDGSVAIVKSAVHPQQKIIAGSKRDENGRVYFKINNPGQIVIDINGQMDDHNAAYSSTTLRGRMPDGSAVHSVAIYANPVLAKPSATEPGARYVSAGVFPATDTNYSTMIFSPGVHIIGPGFKVHPGKSYYIPGDAILYGNMNNVDVPQGTWRCTGDRIRIFGYGTLCGMQIPHYQNNTNNPEYPEWNALTGVKDEDVGIRIVNAWDTMLTGVTIADPANFNTRFDVYPQRVNDQSKASWMKFHSWRVNGDGFGGYAKVEDSFFRTSDDSTYVRDWRRRCTFWKDTNANIFRFANYCSGGLEDCDIIYSRWRHPDGVGSFFEFVSYNGTTAPVLTFRNLRFHDKLSNPRYMIDLSPSAYTFANLRFENVSFYRPMNNKMSTITGSEAAPYAGAVMFNNVTFQEGFDGSSPVRLSRSNYQNYFQTSSFVNSSIFEPALATFSLAASTTNGSIQLNPSGGTYAEGTQVTVTALANNGYSFGSWGGDLSGSTNPQTITMDSNKTVTASFSQTTYTLTETSPNGSVTFNPPGGVYTNGQVVTVTANPDNGYSFGSWGGDLNGSTNPQTITMDGNKTITASFSQTTYTLTETSPNGSVTFNPPGGAYTNGQVVTVTANPDNGYSFGSWGGDLSGSTNPQTITMDSNKTVTASFSQTTYTLTETSQNGSVAFNPPGGVYTDGQVVTVTASPDNGYSFGSWGGDLSGSTNPQTITMDGDKMLTANFSAASSTLPWVVNFNGLPNGTTGQSAPTAWTATRSGLFRVVGDRLEINGTGGEGVFTTQVIDISGGSVNLALGVLGAGGLDASGTSQDYLRLFIKINGGPETLVRQVLGPQAATTWTSSGIMGDTLQIVIRSTVTSSDEYYYLDNLSITHALPSPWQTMDVGTPAAMGFASIADSTWTIAGSGDGIDGIADDFRYVYQTATGDCSIVARVASLTNPNGLAKSAVMIRETTASNAQTAILSVTSANGVIFQWRNKTGTATSSVQVTGQTAPKWLKLTRNGNSVVAHRSDDGTIWTQVGTTQTIRMTSVVTIGMAVTSHNDGALCTSALDHVTAVP